MHDEVINSLDTTWHASKEGTNYFENAIEDYRKSYKNIDVEICRYFLWFYEKKM